MFGGSHMIDIDDFEDIDGEDIDTRTRYGDKVAEMYDSVSMFNFGTGSLSMLPDLHIRQAICGCTRNSWNSQFRDSVSSLGQQCQHCNEGSSDTCADRKDSEQQFS